MRSAEGNNTQNKEAIKRILSEEYGTSLIPEDLDALMSDVEIISCAETGFVSNELPIDLKWKIVKAQLNSNENIQIESPSDLASQINLLRTNVELSPYWNRARPAGKIRYESYLSDCNIFQEVFNRNVCDVTKSYLVWNRAFSKHMQKIINQAESSVYITTSIFSGSKSSDPKNMIDCLCRASNRGCDVKILAGKIGGGKSGINSVKIATSAGIKFRVADRPMKLHTNRVLIDRNVFFAGSHNFTPGSLFRNEELSILVESFELLNEELKIFSREWDIGINYKPAALTNKKEGDTNGGQ